MAHSVIRKRQLLHSFVCLFATFIAISFYMSLWNIHTDPIFHYQQSFSSMPQGAIIPFDLSVNHLQHIQLAAGALPQQAQGAHEDFLPVILPVFHNSDFD